jgi:hypothetical protein
MVSKEGGLKMVAVIKIVRQSCCLFACHSAESYSGVPEYERIVRVWEDGTEEILHQGLKWNEQDFLKKKKG